MNAFAAANLCKIVETAYVSVKEGRKLEFESY